MGDTSMGHSLFHAANAAAAADGEGEDKQQQQSPHEIVHREHMKKHHVHSHKRIHQRQSPADTSAAVTEVTSTVSVIQQVDVDTNGSVLSTQDVPQTSTLPATTDATTSIEPGPISSSVIPSPSASAVASSTATIDVSTSAGQPTSDLTSIPSSAAATTTFATITTGSNTTSATSSTTSSGSISTTSNFSATNLTSTSTSSSSSSISVTSLISSSSISTTSATTSGSSVISETSFISSTQSSLTSSETFSPTPSSSLDSSQGATGSGSGAFTGGVGATGTAASSAATSSATSGAGGSSSDTVTPPTSTVIAGVFGGIAGLGLILVLLLFLVKWHKRRLAGNRPALVGSSDGGARDSTTPVNPTPPQGMSQRMSQRTRFAMPAGLANLSSFRPNRASRQTMGTVSSTAGSERGFVRVSGRKIRSVLESGGDGYGDPPDPNIVVDGASFYQDSHGNFYGGPGSPSSPAAGRRGSGIPNLRPSPARTPVIEHGAFSDLNLDRPPSRPDGASGRSRSGSNAGSHVSASRFTEDI